MRPQPLKILHILSQRPDSTGSGIYLQAMLREAASRGHTNFLVAGIQSDWPARLDGVDTQHCRFVTFGDGDLTHPIVGMSDVMPYASRRFHDLEPAELDRYENAFSDHITRAIEAFAPDIVHCHHLWIATALTRRRFRHIPVVATCHGSDLRQFQNCVHLQKRVLNGCRDLDAVMALSHPQREEIITLYGLSPERVRVVGAGFNHRLFVQAIKPVPRPVRIVYAGKLSRAKGVPWMLRALAGIQNRDWHLHLVGDGSGPEKSSCLALADALGDRVTIHGAVSQDRLAAIMQQSHLFVLPSFFEGLPLVLLEGLASGCRIVTTTLPGVRAVLEGVDADFIDLVPPPRLHHVDQPLPADEGRFENDLQVSLRRQIDAAGLVPDIDLRAIAKSLAAFSWPGIYEKVQELFHTTIGRQSPHRS